MSARNGVDGQNMLKVGAGKPAAGLQGGFDHRSDVEKAQAAGEEGGDDGGERDQVDAGVHRDDALPHDLQGQSGEAGDGEDDVEGDPRGSPHEGSV